MTPEQWQRVRPILESALALDPSSRSSFLRDSCADPSERRELESLVAAHERVGADALKPGAPLNIAFEDEVQFRLPSGKRIGVYEILDEIAVGGMGAVYRAVRADGHYRQQVALKTLRSELGAESTAARFRNERQILASLDHPNIARILDGGSTPDGLPYFAMEFIDGLAITEYCDQHKLSIDERLQMFRTICAAVHYAHQHLVIHRDIKPSNVLVTSDGVPKLLDFGIAKILDPNLLQENRAVTMAGFWVMTPEYASPEQLRGEAITTATDVYSLGLVLYELLTGHHAYHFRSPMPHEIARAVLETDPEKPSTAIGRKAETHDAEKGTPSTPEQISGLRADSPEKLRQRISGDLDNIVLKAIRKEPHERYNSADQLSEDIRRHLEHLPILARKGTFAYRCRKYVVRHKVGVAAAALGLIALLTGILLILREARIARINELRAEKRFKDLRALANSLMFDVHDSIKDLPGSTPARKLIVDRALQYLNGLAAESQGDISLQRELAEAYERVGSVQGHYLQSSLGDTQGSLDSYRKALQSRIQVEAKSSDWKDRLALARTHHLVASLLLATGDSRGARENIEAATAISEALNTIHPKEAMILDELSSDYEITGRTRDMGNPSEVSTIEELYRKAVAIDEMLTQMNPENLEAQYRYAIDLSHVAEVVGSTNPDAALPYHTKELEILQNLQQRSPDIRFGRGVARAYGEIAGVYEAAGDYQRALEYEMRGLTAYQELLRVDPKNNLLQRGVAIEYGNVADKLGKTGNTAMSLSYMQKGLEIMRAIVASSPQNVGQRDTLGQMYMASGSDLLGAHQPEAALQSFAEACEIYQTFQKADPDNMGRTIVSASCVEHMGEAAARAREAKLAADYFHQALASVEPLLSAPTPDLTALYTAADAYSGLGDLSRLEAGLNRMSAAKQRAKWTEARSWYLKSLDAWHRIEHPSHINPAGFDVGDARTVAKNLQGCEAALAHSLLARSH